MSTEDADELFMPDDGTVVTDYVNRAAFNARTFLMKEVLQALVLKEGGEIFHQVVERSAQPNRTHRAGYFSLPAESGYLAAVFLVSAFASLEFWKPLRGMLEAAAYGYHVFKNPDAWMRWLKRDSSNAKKIGREFSFSAIVRDDLKPEHPDLAKAALHFYDETIDRGAHFNVPGLSSNLSEIDRSTGAARFDFLGANDDQMLYGWSQAAQVAYCTLQIFDRVFADEWLSSGLTERIDQFGKAAASLPKGAP
jgi:hypothetical protein